MGSPLKAGLAMLALGLCPTGSIQAQKATAQTAEPSVPFADAALAEAVAQARQASRDAYSLTASSTPQSRAMLEDTRSYAQDVHDDAQARSDAAADAALQTVASTTPTPRSSPPPTHASRPYAVPVDAPPGPKREPLHPPKAQGSP